MHTQLTVRLPEDLSKGIRVMAKRLRLKRSDIVRLALERFLKESSGEREERPYERVKHLLGKYNSGLPDLGQSHRKYIIERIKRRA